MGDSHQVWVHVYDAHPGLPAFHRSSRDARRLGARRAVAAHDGLAVCCLAVRSEARLYSLPSFPFLHTIEADYVQDTWSLPDLRALVHLRSLRFADSGMLLSHNMLQIAALTGLTRLELPGNNIDDSDGDEEGESFMWRLRQMPHLQHLDLGDNWLRADWLCGMTTLTHLRMADNLLYPWDAYVLATLTNLRSLDISQNKIRDAGAKYLTTLTKLTALDASFNALGDYAAEAMASLENLQSLNIDCNAIGPEGASHLARLTGLTSLRVFDNELKADGARHLTALTRLVSLDITWNDIGEEGRKHVRAMKGLTLLHDADEQRIDF